MDKILLNRSWFLVSFVSLIQYQTDLFTRSPLTKDCSTRIYSESMGVYRGQCILLITSKNSIWPLNLNLKKSRVWITILRKIFKKEKLCRKNWDNIGIKFRGGTYKLKQSFHQDFLMYITWYIKYIYSEKATKFCKIFTLLLTGFTVVKSKVLQNSVAFSEYMNFIRNCVYFSSQNLPPKVRLF